MTRDQLEHIIRAACAITGVPELVVIGSQAILGQFPNAPDELLVSNEADVFSFRGPVDNDLIDGSIGELSPFHHIFGYYAHGVGADTAVLPQGWRDRLVPIQNANTGSGCGLCLEPHDLAISKLVAGREKDVDFVGALIRHGFVNIPTLSSRLAATDVIPEKRESAVALLNRIAHS